MIKQVFSVFLLLSMAQFAIGQKTILWKVTAPQSDKISYVVGTFHQFGNSFVDSLPAIKAALSSAELAVFESIDKVEQTRATIAQRAVSKEIEKKMGKKNFRRLQQVAKDWKVDLYKLKPIEVRWKLQQEIQKIKCKTTLPTDRFDHFDSYLIHLAEQNGIALLGLETDSAQLSMIAQQNEYPNWKKERKTIKKLVKQLLSDKPRGANCAFAHRYRQFDLDYAFEKDCKTTILNSKRNEEWMKVLPDLLSTKNTFVAVGYLHLKNQCGILEQLRKQGFKVEPVELRK